MMDYLPWQWGSHGTAEHTGHEFALPDLVRCHQAHKGKRPGGNLRLQLWFNNTAYTFAFTALLC